MNTYYGLHDINQFNINTDYSLSAYIIAIIKTNNYHEQAFEKVMLHCSKKYFLNGIIKSINYFYKNINDNDNYMLSKLIKRIIRCDINMYHKIEKDLRSFLYIQFT